MASDSQDPHLPRPSDAAAGAASGSGTSSDHPPGSSSSSPSSSSDRNVKLLCCYGGLILPRGTDSALRYIGGTTRLITVPRDSSLPDVLRRMAELRGGPVVLRYQLPEDDLDSLISVLSADDLEHMMEEHDRLAADCPNTKIRVFLFSPSGVSAVGPDVLASYHDPHDAGLRFLGANDGFWPSRSRNEGTMSLSSAQDSDAGAMNEGSGDGMATDRGTQDLGGAATTEVNESSGTGTVTDDGLLPKNVPITPTSVQADPDLLSGTSSSNQAELSNPTPLEWPSLVPNETRFSSSIQAELSYVPSYFPLHHAENQNAQMMLPSYSQCALLVGFSPLIGVVSIPVHIIGPTLLAAKNETSFPIRVNSNLKNPSVGNTREHPGDVYFQPLSQLPPLPSPHLLAPNAERNGSHQLASLSQGSTTIIEECSLLGKTLLHVPLDALTTCKKHNDSKDVVSDANVVLPSHHPEDLTRMRAPQGVDVRTLADRGVEIQSENLVAAAPSKANEHHETIPEKPHGGERVDLADILIPPVSVCITSSASHPSGTATNTPKSCEGVNLDLADILVPPVSECMPISSQTSTVNIGFSKLAVKQDVNNKPFVLDTSLVRNLETRTDGITMHGTAPTLLHDCVRPIDLAMEALSKIPPGAPVFSDHPRPAVMSDICSSIYINPEKLPFVTVNTHNTGQNNRANEPSVSNPLMSSIFIPGARTDHVLIDQQPSAVRDAAYLQCIQPANSSHSSNTEAIHGPYSYHVEAGVGQRGMFKHLDTAYSNNDATKNPIVKDEAPIILPVDRLSDIAISQTGISPLYSSCHAADSNQLHKVVALDSVLISDMDTQKAQASSVPSKQTIITKEFLKKNCPVNGMRSEIIASKESALSNLPDYLNTDPTYLEEVCIEQDIQSFEGKIPVPSAEVPVPALSSHETKVISSDKEFGIVENNIAMENGQTETIKNNQLQKIMHSFPNSDEIGSLQVIRNSDLEELQKLGSGSFGTVYHGKWRGSDVEIKRIHDRIFSENSSEQEHARAVFWTEACKLASLHHPNVVAFYGIVLDDPGESIATVTEFMVNGSLGSALQNKDNTVDRRGRLLIAMDVAFGMEYLHSKKIIHFDLRSDNLLVNLRDPQRPVCKVGDLGLSKVKYDALVSGRMQGSLPWMAPELFAGKDDECNEKVDVFSFGIVMWELLTGERPYKDMHYAAIIGGILKDTLRPPVPESCDAEWRSLMEKCWCTEPSQRPSFTEIATRLRAMDAPVPENR